MLALVSSGYFSKKQSSLSKSSEILATDGLTKMWWISACICFSFKSGQSLNNRFLQRLSSLIVSLMLTALVYTLSAEGPMAALLQSHKLIQMAPTVASDWSGDLSVVSVLCSAESILTNISAQFTLPAGLMSSWSVLYLLTLLWSIWSLLHLQKHSPFVLNQFPESLYAMWLILRNILVSMAPSETTFSACILITTDLDTKVKQ